MKETRPRVRFPVSFDGCSRLITERLLDPELNLLRLLAGVVSARRGSGLHRKHELKTTDRPLSTQVGRRSYVTSLVNKSHFEKSELLQKHGQGRHQGKGRESMSSLGIVNPKKKREIEGVSSSSLIDLKATLFSAEENVCCPTRAPWRTRNS
jgi:hypothetical protein